MESLFEKQFRKKNIDKELLSTSWAEQYSSIESIDKEWYKEVPNKITSEEWNEALQKTRNNSASDLSGITYLVLKNINTKTKEACTRLFTKCIRVGSIPLK